MTHEEARAVLRPLELSCPPWPEGRMDTWASTLARDGTGVAARAAAEALERLLADRDPLRIYPALILEFARMATPRLPELPAPEPPPVRRIPGIAPTTVIPGCFDPEHSKGMHYPPVRTTPQERGRMNAQAMRQSEEAFVARKRATAAKIREMVGGLFLRAIEQRKRGGQRIAGAYCDWCDRDLQSLDDLSSYFEWVASIGGRSTEDRVFGNCCVKAALKESN